jgi:uncharacterized protein involved in exopolysaccharide biosynthesis/Mrp family chromosome partitioning ATPase
MSSEGIIGTGRARAAASRPSRAAPRGAPSGAAPETYPDTHPGTFSGPYSGPVSGTPPRASSGPASAGHKAAATNTTTTTTTTTTGTNFTADALFTPADLLRVIAARRRLILRVAALVVAITAVIAMLLPTVYSATAVVLLDQRKNAVADASAVLSNLPTDPASIQNQIQILSSRDLAGAVVDKLDLVNDPEFNPAKSTSPLAALPSLHTLINPFKWFAPAPPAGSTAAAEATRENIIDAVLNRLSVTTVGLSTSIDVRFRDHSAQKAARIANEFAALYVDQQIQLKSAAARQATKWLTARVGQLSDQVQQAETAVQKYKAAHNLNQGAGGISLTEQQLGAINGQLILARADLAAKRATYSRVKALIASGHVADVSQVVSSPLIVKLRTQEATLLQQEADLATRYGPRHPKLIAVESQRRDLEAKLKQEVDRIAGSLENDVAVVEAQVASLKSSLRQTERSAARQNLATVKLKALQTDAASTRSMYQTFVTRLRQTQDQEAMQVSDARVISPAPVPSAPASPHRSLLVLASIPAGLLLGLLAALMAERFGFAAVMPRSARRASRDIRAATAMSGAQAAPAYTAPPPPPMRQAQMMQSGPLPVLGRIRDAAFIRAVDYVIDWPHSEFAQGINAMLQTIATPPRGARPHVVAITAAAAEEGKTAIALGLARAAARAGWRTVLIDGDLTRAPSARSLGYRSGRFGLIDALRGAAPLSRCFLKDPRSPLLLLSNFTSIANGYSVLSSQPMAKLIAHLRGSTDLVIVDATPLSALNESHALLRLSDAVVLAADPRRMSDAHLRRASETLAVIGAPSPGIVIAG